MTIGPVSVSVPASVSGAAGAAPGGPQAAVVVIGAGQAGLHAAFTARAHGWDGRIVLVNGETAAPYSRPLLSKSHLMAGGDRNGRPLRPPTTYAEAGIEVPAGVLVDRIDRSGRSVHLSGRTVVPYERLVIATGAEPRLLPGAASAPRPGPSALPTGVLTLRTVDDAHELRRRLTTARRVVVVGGGVLGLEVASSATALGAAVTVVEAAPGLMGRAASALIGAHLQRLHVDRGVDIQVGVAVLGIERDGGGAVTGLRTSNGDLSADLVVLALGISPRTDLAAEAGLDVDDGILVDAALITSDPLIAAAGDCARQSTPGTGRGLRSESEQSAIDQGTSAGRWLASGDRASYLGTSCSWTEQHGQRIFLAGRLSPGDEPVFRGDPDSASFAIYHLRDGRLTAVEAVNSVADYRAARRILSAPEANCDFDAERIADRSQPVRALAPST